jgi:hypothetical protein
VIALQRPILRINVARWGSVVRASVEPIPQMIIVLTISHVNQSSS